MEPESTATAMSYDLVNPDAAVVDLPDNRFALELEFLQALASPNYLHFLATCKVGGEDVTVVNQGSSNEEEDDEETRAANHAGGGGLLLHDPAFRAFLRYLQRTWTQPEYARYISYPHALFFLEVLLQDEDGSVAKEWTLPAFRNFCHQQQFLAWQHRHAQLYGMGSASSSSTTHTSSDAAATAPNGGGTTTT